MQGIDCFIKRGNVLPDPLLLSVEVVNGILTFFLNLLRDCELYRR
jgi:hypothetical protein